MASVEGIIFSTSDNQFEEPMLRIIIVILSFGISSLSFAEMSVVLQAGTPGLGLQVQNSYGEYLGIRGVYNTFSIDYDRRVEGVDYDVDFELDNFGLMVDWHPFKNGFRISAGIMQNSNEVKGEANLVATQNIGGVNFTPAQIGTLEADIEFNSTAPYLGIGYGHRFGSDRRWSVDFDLGIMFQGEPDVELRGVGGLLQNNPAFIAAVEAEEAELEDDIDSFKYFPIITLGLSYKF